MARETITTMQEPTNPENNEGNSLRPVPTRSQPDSAAVTHGIPTSAEAQARVDEISRELGAGLAQLRGEAVRTLPDTSRTPSTPLITRRQVAAGLGLGILGAIGFGATRLFRGNNDSPRPTPGVSGGVSGIGNGGETPTAQSAAGIATEPARGVAGTPAGTPTVELTQQIIPGNPDRPTATAYDPSPTSTLPRQEIPTSASQTPIASSTPKGPDGFPTPGATRAVDGTATPTPPKEKTVTPEVKKEFSVSVNIIQPGDPKYEVVFGRIEAIPIKSVGLNPEYRHPSGLNAEQMQKRANAYGHAAARYAAEWWAEQPIVNGDKPQSRPPDVSPNHPKIREYMANMEPYPFRVFAGDIEMINRNGVRSEVMIDPKLGYTVNFIPIPQDQITYMIDHFTCIPNGTKSCYKLGVDEEGRISYNFFATPGDMVNTPDRVTRAICGMINNSEIPILVQSVRIKPAPADIDPNLVDLYFSTIKSPSAVSNTMKIDRPTETPLYISK